MVRGVRAGMASAVAAQIGSLLGAVDTRNLKRSIVHCYNCTTVLAGERVGAVLCKRCPWE